MNETERFYMFTGLVAQANKALRRAQEKYTKLFGLRSVHVTCMLHLLGAPGGLSATELSELCDVDRAQISRVTAELLAQGLICETSPGGTKRRYRGALSLTERGEEQAKAMRAIVSEKLGNISDALNPEDVDTFYRVFREIVERIRDV